MNVASLELSKELFELSGWKDTHFSYRATPSNSGKDYRVIDISPNIQQDIPAYDLGYLLRKLPSQIALTKGIFYACTWIAEDHNDSHNFIAKTPEDAVAKLAIELFKQGILTKGEEK